MYPFGDIAPLDDFRKDLVCRPPEALIEEDPEMGHGTSVTDYQAIVNAAEHALPVHYRNMSDVQQTKIFEKLVTKKYRLTVADVGGHARGAHWLEELSQPITVTQDRIMTDLTRFVNEFPLELIPHKSDLERDIGKL